MKEVIGKMHQHSKSELPCNPFVDKKYMILQTEVAKKFNEFSQILAHLLQERFLLQLSFLKVF